MRNGSFLIGFIGGIIGTVMAGLWMFVGAVFAYMMLREVKEPIRNINYSETKKERS